MTSRFGGRVFRFPGVVVDVSPDGRRVETRWPDGVTLVAVPEETEAYRNRALELGYSGDDPAAQMNAEHDLVHHFLALLQGHRYSHRLRAIADGAVFDPNEASQEEAAVLGFQRWLQAGEVVPELSGYLSNRVRLRVTGELPARWAALLDGTG